MTTTQDRLFMRQTGFYDPSEHREAKVTFVGVGGIGSFAAMAVAKLGVPDITLIDPDVCEIHNVPNQFHSLTNGEHSTPKVAALAQEIQSHIGSAPTCFQARIGEHGWETSEGLQLPPRELDGVVISGLDSMKARYDLWHNKIALNPTVSRYIDGRLAGRRILIYSVNPTDMTDVEKYEATLVDDDAVEDAPCTERGLIDVGFQVGALICHQVRCHYTGDDVPNIIHMNQHTLKLDKGGWM